MKKPIVDKMKSIEELQRYYDTINHINKSSGTRIKETTNDPAYVIKSLINSALMELAEKMYNDMDETPKPFWHKKEHLKQITILK